MVLTPFSAPYRKGKYFRKQITYGGSAALWDSISVAASGQATTGNAFIPPSMETFVHDDDGNLTSDARWDYEWDAENRLKVVRSRSGSPAPERRIEFAAKSDSWEFSREPAALRVSVRRRQNKLFKA
ncbi:MAG TPA: hypothetical protein VN673_04560 [Clostridia bacterium]|nr:hypothetical protein [Clostridia bacterium]